MIQRIKPGKIATANIFFKKTNVAIKLSSLNSRKKRMKKPKKTAPKKDAPSSAKATPDATPANKDAAEFFHVVFGISVIIYRIITMAQNA